MPRVITESTRVFRGIAVSTRGISIITGGTNGT